jgi:hypothetical protein
MLPDLADADRCPVVHNYEPGVAVRCSYGRGHDRPRLLGTVWHLADRSPYRAAWPDRRDHCPVTYLTQTPGGSMKVWCGNVPGHDGQHEAVTGGMPVRWL